MIALVTASDTTVLISVNCSIVGSSCATNAPTVARAYASFSLTLKNVISILFLMMLPPPMIVMQIFHSVLDELFYINQTFQKFFAMIVRQNKRLTLHLVKQFLYIVLIQRQYQNYP